MFANKAVVVKKFGDIKSTNVSIYLISYSVFWKKLKTNKGKQDQSYLQSYWSYWKFFLYKVQI